MSKTCPNCGMKQPNAKFLFCVSCGTNLKTGERSNNNQIEEIEKSKAARNSTALSNDDIKNYVPKAPVLPEQPKKQTTVYQSSVISSNSAPVKNSNENNSAPVTNAKPVYKSSVVPVSSQNTTANNSAPATNAKPVYKSSVINSSASNSNNSTYSNAVPSQSSGGFKTSSLNKPVNNMTDAFETGILEEETSNASPVQTISEVKQELPKPMKKDIPADNKTVASCIGLDVKTAQSMIERAGLKAVIIRQNDERIAKNEVIKQDIPAGSNVAAGTEVKLFVSCGTWSVWSEKEPDSNGYEIESKTEYRIRTREKKIDKKTSKTSDSMEGYTLCDSKKGYGDWVVEPYFTNTSKKVSEICELVDNLIGFKYCGWFYKGNKNLTVESFSTLESALYFNKDTSKSDWEYRETVSYNNIKETVVAWTPASEKEMPETPAGDKVTANIRMATYRVDGNNYPLKYGSFETQWYKYRNRSMNGITYYFEKEGYSNWSKWSDWNEKSDVSTEFKEVESRVMYRCKEIPD